MKIPRTVTALASAALLLPMAAAPAFAAPTKSWGPYYAPAGKAKAVGKLKATGEDHAVLPTARTVKVTGKLTDLARPAGICGWAVFQIAVRKGSNFTFKSKNIRDCSYGTAKAFAFSYHNVYQVELKVCSEPKAAKPSIACLAGGTWKILYTSPH